METVVEALKTGSISKDVRQLIRILESWKLKYHSLLLSSLCFHD